MCGIAGFIGFPDNYRLAKQANIIQQHRGPDNQSIWSDYHIALAHQRLSIIDLTESANQPMHKDDLVIVFNGEIYNYKDLRDKLIKEKNISFKTSSDTEVVIEMYKAYGESCLQSLIGMFAFGIYNKTDGSLFLARDHFGIKPLFYSKVDGTFAFSSELKTLTALPGFKKDINHKALVSCLNYIWVSGNETMFSECHKLPPAHYLILTKNGGTTIKRFWKLPEPSTKADSPNEKDTAKHLTETMKKSIERHMVADVPVSSFLSGGLDSSLISMLAKNADNFDTCYTIGTQAQDKKGENMPDDELYAREIAESSNLNHEVITIESNIVQNLPMMVRTLDEPIGDPAALNTYLICKAARARGVKVLLSGMGADEIFFGYRRHQATMYAQKYQKLPPFLQKAINTITQVLPVRINGKGFKFGRWSKRFVSFASLPIEKAYMRSYSYYDELQLKDILKEEYHPAVDAIYREHKDVFEGGFNNDLVNQICNTDIQMFMVGLNLTYTDRASMATSVEVRVPFIDKIVIDTAMKIPGEIKFKNGITKNILKKASEGILSKKIAYRPKASFGAPIRSWISNDLKEMVDDLLSKKNVDKRGILNYAYVKQLIDDDRKGWKDNAYQIYQLITLELWFREFIDKGQYEEQ